MGSTSLYISSGTLRWAAMRVFWVGFFFFFSKTCQNACTFPTALLLVKACFRERARHTAIDCKAEGRVFAG